MDNPLIEAFDVHERILEIQGAIMHTVKGDAAFEPFDEELCQAVNRLIYDSADKCRDLPPRARIARLNAIWRDWLEQTAGPREDTSGDASALPTGA